VKRFETPIIALLVLFSNLNVANSQQQRGTQNIHQAIINGEIDQVKKLLSSGVDINFKNRMGRTPLHTAMLLDKWEIVDFLLSKDPDLNAQENQGRTPLFIAVEKEQMKYVEMFLAKKVDVNAVSRGGQNALTMSRSKGNKDMTDLLLKHGAEEPVLDMEGDMYYGMRGNVPGGTSAAGAATAIQPITPARPANEPSPLEDPNEIKSRIKTFEGLGKAIKEVADKSVSEERQWRQTRYDNRMLLSKAVQTQFDNEMALIKKTAAEEKSEKTITAIDTLVSQKQARSKNVYKELLQQRREMAQAQSMGRGRGRGRSTGRGGRGRTSMAGGQYGNDMGMDSYYGDGDMMGGMARPTRPTRPQEQRDQQTEAEIRLWTQATIERKNELLKSVHEQIMAEMDSVRFTAKEEEAKKTMATIDGLMLARLMRYDQLVLNMEEDARKAEERQLKLEQRGYGRGRGGQLQGDSTQQQNMQQRGRGRRR
jgi:hypothetical protein